MDYGRYMQALDAQYIEDVESYRVQFLAGKVKPEDMPTGVWDSIKEHDALLEG